MGKYRIIIEGQGQHHTEGGAPVDADKVAKDTSDTLVAMGHKVTRAGFQKLGDEQKEHTFTDSEVLEEQDLLPAPVETESGTGDKPE